MHIHASLNVVGMSRTLENDHQHPKTIAVGGLAVLTQRCSQSVISLASYDQSNTESIGSDHVQSESSRACSHFALACSKPALAAPCAALTVIQLRISTITAGLDCGLPQYSPTSSGNWDARAYSGIFTHVGGQADEAEGRKVGR